MTKKLISAILIYLLSMLIALAETSTTKPEMAEAFRKEGKIYVVIAVAGIILIGIVCFLIMLERKINKLEKSVQ